MGSRKERSDVPAVEVLVTVREVKVPTLFRKRSERRVGYPKVRIYFRRPKTPTPLVVPT